jgi:hypothetical protein
MLPVTRRTKTPLGFGIPPPAFRPRKQSQAKLRRRDFASRINLYYYVYLLSPISPHIAFPTPGVLALLFSLPILDNVLALPLGKNLFKPCTYPNSPSILCTCLLGPGLDGKPPPLPSLGFLGNPKDGRELREFRIEGGGSAAF